MVASARKNVLMAVPASKMRAIDWFAELVRVKSSNNPPLAAAPTSAMRNPPRAPPARPATSAMDTISVAPWFTPMIDGSATGLRSTPCIIAPESASTPPTSTAHSARGNLASCTSTCSRMSSS